MPGFAVADNPGNIAAAAEADAGNGPAAAAPVPWYGAVAASFDNSVSDQMLGARDDRLDAAFYARQRDIEARTGVKLKMPYATGIFGEGPVALGEPSDDAGAVQAAAHGGDAAIQGAYEAQIDDLRRKYPQAMAGVPTADQVRATVAGQLNAIGQSAATGAAQHPFAAFVGGVGGQLLDPINLGAAVATGGLAEGLPLGFRILAQSGAWGSLAAAEAPLRHAEAQEAGGPAYGLPEAEGDIAGGLAAGPVFELGGAGLKALFGPVGRAIASRFPAAAAGDDAARGAMQALDQFANDGAAVGPLRDGADFGAGTQAMAQGAPPPPIEPSAELDDLFGGGPAPAAPILRAASPILNSDPSGAQLFEAAEYRGRPIYSGSFDPAALTTDPATFQYKAGGDAQGVTDRLRGVQAWDPTSSGKIISYEPADGPMVIADGHQRLGLANRMADKGFEPRLDGYLFRQADGWSPQAVRTIAALKNIREGQGSPLDAAKVLRDAPGSMNDDSLPVSGAFISQAKGLARLSPDAFGAVVNKVIPENYAAKIGELAGERPDLHAGMVRLLRAGDPANLDEAHSLVQEAMLDDWLSGQGEQSDLFGDTPAQSLAIGRAKLRASLMRSLKGDAKLFGQLVRHADAIEAGGNVLARDANDAELATTNAALETIAKLGMRAGDIGDAMTEGARKITEGGKVADATRPILARIKRALASGERLDEGRSALLQGDTLLTGAETHAAAFDEVGGKGQAGQIAPKPEEAHLEAPEGAGSDHVIVGDPLPKRGLAPALLKEDGKIYVGPPNTLHFEIAERFPTEPGNDVAEIGFVTPDGKFLGRDAAAAWVREHEGELRPSENMGAGLDAMDYREQVPEGRRHAPEGAAPEADAPEDHPGLFADIPGDDGEARALDHLNSCAPG